MSKNIPVNEETYDIFTEIKETIRKITPEDKVTNDTFILSLLSSMPGRDKIDLYNQKNKELTEQLTVELNTKNKKVK